jgi:thymidylate synthase ThyX
MSIKSEIIKDSINSYTNDRLTTFVLRFPRFINAEILRHRALSFSSASSRAIPSKKIIEDVLNDPAMPVFWGKNQSGMQAYEELENNRKDEGYFWYGELGRFLSRSGLGGDSYECSTDFQTHTKGAKDSAQKLWLSARNSMVAVAERLTEIGLHKQISNRVVEAFQNITLIISGTEWENFFKLRASEFAQPEFRALAEMMLEQYNKSIPNIKNPVFGKINLELLNSGNGAGLEHFLNKNTDWHIPYEDKMPAEVKTIHDKLKVAIARCARVSYLTQDGEINVEKDYELYDRLTSSGHMSPCEHVAFPITDSKHVGNFKGWFQFRKLLPNENQQDSRVIKRKVINGKVG